MTRALIMAAGQQTRWPHDARKHFAVIEGERLLDRTVRQLRCRAIEPVVVATDPELAVIGAELFDPGPSACLAETVLLSSPRFAEDRTIVFLGDVYFSEAAIEALAAPSAARVAGRFGPSLLTGGCPEIFGMGWGGEFTEGVVSALAVTVDDARTQQAAGRHGKPNEPGSLWQVYRDLAGFGLYDHKREDRIWLEIDDWTDDIDTPSRYEDFKDRLARRWLRDQG